MCVGYAHFVFYKKLCIAVACLLGVALLPLTLGDLPTTGALSRSSSKSCQCLSGWHPHIALPTSVIFPGRAVNSIPVGLSNKPTPPFSRVAYKLCMKLV